MKNKLNKSKAHKIKIARNFNDKKSKLHKSKKTMKVKLLETKRIYFCIPQHEIVVNKKTKS